jgi:hypothetical protein
MTDQGPEFPPEPLDLRLKQEIALNEAKIRLYNEMPPILASALSLYVTKHIHPGDCLRGLLSGDNYEFEQRADDATWDARETMIRWMAVAAPEESWGDEESVSSWLRRKPRAMTVAEIEGTNMAETQDENS